MHTNRRHRARRPYHHIPSASEVAKTAKTAGDVAEALESVLAFIPGVGGALALGAKGAKTAAKAVETNARKLASAERRKKHKSRKHASTIAKKLAKKHGLSKEETAARKADLQRRIDASESHPDVAAEALHQELGLDVVDDGGPAGAASSGGGFLSKLGTGGKVALGAAVVAVGTKLAKLW